MEFGRLKGFWKGASTKRDVIANNKKPPRLSNHNSNNNSNRNHNNETVSQLEALDEIRPEVTSEGYGLRTPYGTHLNLDFVKYCEDIGQNFKRTSSLRKPRSRTTSSTTANHNPAHQQARLGGGPSVESIDSLASDSLDMSRTNVTAENTLMETRRRLEAFRSFRTKRTKSSDGMNAPPMSNQNHSKNGYNAYNARRGSISPSGSSSGSLTPNSLGGLLNGNQVTPQHLQIVREQMAAALLRLRELEEQVKTIPVLQVKISVLQQEKKHLLEELKAAESRPTSPGESDSCVGSPHDLKLSPRKSILSTSSGISSISSQSLLSSPRSPQHVTMPTATSPLYRALSSEGPISPKFPKGAPPPPPKRKYRSIAVGDTTPVEDIICYSKGERDFANVGSTCNLLTQRKRSVDFSSIVKEFDIDAAFDIFPPPPKQFSDSSTSTDSIDLNNTFVQTTLVASFSAATQTTHNSHNDIGCGDAVFREMHDKSCGTPPSVSPRSCDVAVMVSPPVKETCDQETSSLDLITKHHVCIGDHINTATRGTSTVRFSCASKSTTCDDLISYDNASAGPDDAAEFADVATATNPTVTQSVSVECDIPLTPVVEYVDKDTMTATSTGRWCSYESTRTVSCGDDCDMYASRTISTNTDKLTTRDQLIGTNKNDYRSKSTSANIRKPSQDSCTNTTTITKSDFASDCADIQPVLMQTSTNTTSVETTTSSTQYSINKANLVDSTVNTDVISMSDASTETSEEKSKDIDTYVDKVQSLLEEQQSLLAENYKVFTDEWDGKNNKISRFVNPAFSSSAVEEEIKPSQASTTSAAISASLSLISLQEEEETESSSDDESDFSEDEERPVLRPLPSLDLDVELKSIMKKPGTPVREKKFLTFAEGVKSDESSSEEEESSSEEEEEEEDEIKLEEDSVKEEIRREIKDISVKEEIKEEKKIEEKITVVVERSEFNYSNEFVKKVEKIEPESKVEVDACVIVTDEKSIPDERLVGDGAEEDEVFLESSTKYIFTTEVLDACDVLEKHLRNPKSVEKRQLILSTSIVQHEWFRVAAQINSSRNLLDDFVTDLADTSLPVLRKVVNMTDTSGNTVLHYAISHGNIQVVESLLCIDELDVNKSNQAGYTAAMLAALCDIKTDIECKVFKQLFAKSNVNTHAKEAGQTALMLAVSHGRLKTAQLLLTSGADINARDEDGSTALMCAVEHGQLEAVKLLLTKSTCDATMADTDGSTALSIAMDAGHRDVAILLYAQLNFKPASSNSETNKIVTIP